MRSFSCVGTWTCSSPSSRCAGPEARGVAVASDRVSCARALRRYNTIMKLIFISATFSIIWYMRRHRVVSQTYSKEEDTFKIVYLIAPAALLALLVNHELSVMEVRVQPVRRPAGLRIDAWSSRGAGALDILDLPGGGGHPAAAGTCA